MDIIPQFGWLSGQGAELVAHLLEVCEAMGGFPKTIANLTVALLPKPNGDTRPTGL